MCIVCDGILKPDEFVYGNNNGTYGQIQDVKNLCIFHAKQILKIMMDV